VEAMEAYKVAKANEEQEGEKCENALSLEDEVEIDGEMIKVADLVAAYQGKQNAEASQDEKADLEVQKTKSKPAEKKVNEELKNASFQGFAAPTVETAVSKQERGKARYGKKVSVGGNK
jgi:hypothetical protein